MKTFLGMDWQDIRSGLFPVSLSLQSLMPENGLWPVALKINADTGAAEISGKNLTPGKVRLNFAADMKRDDSGRISVDALSMALTDSKNTGLLNFAGKGEWLNEHLTGSVHGRLNAGSSPLTDALVSGIYGRKLENFILSSEFALCFNEKRELAADGSFHLSASGLPVQGVASSMLVRGVAMPEARSLRIDRMELSLKETGKKFDLSAVLQKPLSIICRDGGVVLQNADMKLSGRRNELAWLNLPVKKGLADFDIVLQSALWPGKADASGKIALSGLPEGAGDAVLKFKGSALGRGMNCTLESAMTAAESPLFDLKLEGSYEPGSNAPLVLNIDSQYINADRLAAWTAAATAAPENGKKAEHPVQKAAAAPAECSAPAPLDLAPYNGKVNLHLAKVEYTPWLTLALDGNTLIDGSQVRFDSRIKVNDAPGELSARLDAGESGGYPFEGRFRISGLAVPPVIMAASGGTVNNASGVVSMCQGRFSGRGWHGTSLLQHGAGQVSFAAEDLSFPAASAGAVKIVNMIFLPIDSLLQVSARLQKISPELAELREEIEDILNGSKNFRLAEGSGAVRFGGGIVEIDDVVFSGGTFDREELSGKVNLNSGAIRLYSSVSKGSLELPVDINGTLSRPEPDYAGFAVNAAGRTLQESLKPENIKNTIQTIDSIINLFK